MSYNFTITVFYNENLNVNFIRAVLLPTETTEEVMIVNEIFYPGDPGYEFTYGTLTIVVGENIVRITDNSTDEPDREIVWSGYTRSETVSVHSNTPGNDRPNPDEESRHQQENTIDIHHRHIYTCHVCSSINQHCICLRVHCWHCGTRL